MNDSPTPPIEDSALIAANWIASGFGCQIRRMLDGTFAVHGQSGQLVRDGLDLPQLLRNLTSGRYAFLRTERDTEIEQRLTDALAALADCRRLIQRYRFDLDELDRFRADSRDNAFERAVSTADTVIDEGNEALGLPT